MRIDDPDIALVRSLERRQHCGRKCDALNLHPRCLDFQRQGEILGLGLGGSIRPAAPRQEQEQDECGRQDAVHAVASFGLSALGGIGTK
jgi:hypothetical protein